MKGRKRSCRSRSSLFSRSLRLGEMCWLLNILAALIGTVFWKKARSSVRIARFTGGRSIESKFGGLDICYRDIMLVSKIGPEE